MRNPIKNTTSQEPVTLTQLLKPGLIPLILMVVAWLVFLLEFLLNQKFNYLGIWPKRFLSLPTFFTYWAIHGDLKHLFNNTVPTLFLGWGLFYFYPRIAFKTLAFVTLFPALLIWLAARDGYHIGASVIVYGLASFLFFAGVYARNIRNAAFSLLIVFLYGGLIWGIFPVEPRVSWEGHLFGGLAGLIMVWHYRKVIKPKVEPISDSATSISDDNLGLNDFEYTFKENP
jgi:membrane associated rhomboid family serine protease